MINGAAITLVGSAGTQVWIGRRAARETRRQGRYSSLLEIYGGVTELYAVVLDHAKRKREAGGATPGGAVEMMTRNLQLRLHLEMLDDDKVREIASKTLDNLANLGQGLAPGPREQEIGREQRQRISRQSTATRESGRSNW